MNVSTERYSFGLRFPWLAGCCGQGNTWGRASGVSDKCSLCSKIVDWLVGPDFLVLGDTEIQLCLIGPEFPVVLLGR